MYDALYKLIVAIIIKLVLRKRSEFPQVKQAINDKFNNLQN